MAGEFSLDARCPACGAAQLSMRSMVQDIAYFGETLHTVLLCAACGFRHAQSTVLAQRPPKRHTLAFRAPADLGVRVVRSHTGTFRIPELGFTAEPAEGSEAFVSNLEGVLERVRDVLVRARLVFDDPAEHAKLEGLLQRLQRIADGKEGATLVLEDPLGNSGIHSDRAEVHDLSPEEAARLRTGMVLVNAEQLREP